jgi:hypothetical protein
MAQKIVKRREGIDNGGNPSAESLSHGKTEMFHIAGCCESGGIANETPFLIVGWDGSANSNGRSDTKAVACLLDVCLDLIWTNSPNLKVGVRQTRTGESLHSVIYPLFGHDARQK